jgi:hypothetical protein
LFKKKGINIPVALPNAPNVFTVANHDIAQVVVDAMTAGYLGVNVFTWDTINPLENLIR